MELDPSQISSLFSNLSVQIRGALSNLYLASTQTVSAEARENDRTLDEKAAVLDQGFYRLLGLVNALSEAQLLIDGKALSMQDTDLAALVKTVCERSSDLASLLGLELSCTCTESPLVCAIAPDEIEGLLYRLLSNAFKFTPAGGKVAVELKKEGETVVLSVADTGCGIPEEEMETLFCRCLRSPSIPASAPHGLGLGLALCRAIAEAHGGTILVTSRVGEGSRFVVSLPYRLTGKRLADVPLRYDSGFNRTLLGLADALPSRAFCVRALD